MNNELKIQPGISVGSHTIELFTNTGTSAMESSTFTVVDCSAPVLTPVPIADQVYTIGSGTTSVPLSAAWNLNNGVNGDCSPITYTLVM